MSGLIIPLEQQQRAAAIRAALRRHAGVWISRFYRHDLLVARAVRGFQVEAVDLFTREVVQPVIRRLGAGLAGYDRRGVDIIIEADPVLRSIVQDVQQIVRRGVDAVRRRTEGNVGDLVKEEVEWMRQSAQRVLRVEPPAVVAERVIDAVGQRPYLGGKTEEWFASLVGGDNGAADNVRAMVQTGIARGWTVDEIVRSLRGRKSTGYTDGLLTGQNVTQVRTMVRTAATHASATARIESFRAMGVTRWRFVATLDSKTSIQCAASDGKTFPVGEGPQPPLHPNCRSTAVPDIGEPIGNRASIDGPVPADTTFPDWLEGQPRGVQDEMLGKSRAAAWREGNLSLEDMLGPSLQPLSLAELRALDRIPDPSDDA